MRDSALRRSLVFCRDSTGNRVRLDFGADTTRLFRAPELSNVVFEPRFRFRAQLRFDEIPLPPQHDMRGIEPNTRYRYGRLTLRSQAAVSLKPTHCLHPTHPHQYK